MFWKISNFGSNSNGVSLWFYQKMFVHNKNWLEIRISFPWGPYSLLFRHFGVVYKFLRVLKISSFGSKPKGVSLRFYRKTYLCDKNWSEIHILSTWEHKGVSLWFYRKNVVRGKNYPKIHISSTWGSYSCSVRRSGVVHKFLGVLKNIKFQLKTQRGWLAFGFTKNVYSRWKLAENLYFIHVRPIFLLG
jgi:hypothetical protein